jgi:RHS repeat-associated protein
MCATWPGRVTAIADGHGQDLLLGHINRLPDGRIHSFEQGNRLKTVREYGQDGRLTSIKVGGVMHQEYERDHDGRIIRITDRISPELSQSFAYDKEGRLIKAQGPYGSREYAYDLAGNRLMRKKDAGVDTYQYQSGSNRLQAVEGLRPGKLAHDKGGSCTALGPISPWSRMGLGEKVRYEYNGLGQRTLKIDSGSTIVYHYDSLNRLIAETDQHGGLIKEYIWLDHELIAVGESGAMYYVHTNHRNQPHLASDQEGQVVWRGVSTPFGSTSIDNGQGGPSGLCLNLRLPGQYFDAETGFHHNYHRDYSPELGRYLQADPIGLNGGMNLYGYCGNDPVNREDRWGLFETGGYGGYSDDFGTDDDDHYGGGEPEGPGNIGGVGADSGDSGGWEGSDDNPYDDQENDDSRPATNNITVSDDDLEIELTLEEENSSLARSLAETFGRAYQFDTQAKQMLAENVVSGLKRSMEKVGQGYQANAQAQQAMANNVINSTKKSLEMVGQGALLNAQAQQAMANNVINSVNKSLGMVGQGALMNAQAQQELAKELAKSNVGVEATVQKGGNQISFGWELPSNEFNYAFSRTTSKSPNASIGGYIQNDNFKIDGAPPGTGAIQIDRFSVNAAPSDGKYGGAIHALRDYEVSYSYTVKGGKIEIEGQKGNSSNWDIYNEYEDALQQVREDQRNSYFSDEDIVEDDEYEVDYDYNSPDPYHEIHEAFRSPIESIYDYEPYNNPLLDHRFIK